MRLAGLAPRRVEGCTVGIVSFVEINESVPWRVELTLLNLGHCDGMCGVARKLGDLEDWVGCREDSKEKGEVFLCDGEREAVGGPLGC